MADKFFTTARKKQVTAVGLGIAGWHVLTMGANPLHLPALPAFISTPLIGGVSLLNASGLVVIWAIFMMSDY